MIVVQMCDDSFSMWMCLWNGFEVLLREIIAGCSRAAARVKYILRVLLAGAHLALAGHSRLSWPDHSHITASSSDANSISHKKIILPERNNNARSLHNSRSA